MNPRKMRVFLPFIDAMTLQDLDNGQNIAGDFFIGEENVTARFEPVGALEAYANHKIEVTVKSWEHFPDGSRSLVKVGGADWNETRDSRFRTGPRPEVIEPDQVAYTYPIDRQAYFLRNETSRNRGMLKYLGPNQNYLFEEEDDEGNPYQFFARFIKLEDGTTANGDIALQSDKFYFNLPELENSTIYGVQIIRKKLPPPRSFQDEIRDRVGQVSDNPTVVATIEKAFALGVAGTAKVDLLKVELLPTERSAYDEKILYKFHFRTSAYNSFAGKMAGFSPGTEYNYFGGSLFENVQLKGVLTEPFDEFEVNGLFKNGRQVLRPLLDYMDLQSNYSYNNMANYWVYRLHRDVKRLNGRLYKGRNATDPLSGRIRFSVSLSDFASTRNGQGIFNLLPFKTIKLSSTSYIGQPLADWELDRAAGVGEYSPAASGTGSTPVSSSGGFAGLSAGINGQSASISSPLFSGVSFQTSSPTYRFELLPMTSLYVKTDAMSLRSQLSRWMASRRRILMAVPIPTNAELLSVQDPVLHNRVNQFLALPTSYFSYRNGNYRYRISYKYPMSGFSSSGITKTFIIDDHDESLR